jgi:hypothetical protein
MNLVATGRNDPIRPGRFARRRPIRRGIANKHIGQAFGQTRARTPLGCRLRLRLLSKLYLGVIYSRWHGESPHLPLCLSAAH